MNSVKEVQPSRDTETYSYVIIGEVDKDGRRVPGESHGAYLWATQTKYGKLADGGDADAQYRMGCMYANGDGRGKPLDYTKALEWFHKSADQGNADAQFWIGWMYRNGEGVPQDDAEAVKWYRKAAEQGDSPAQTNLGCAYTDGNGVPQNFTEAVKWFHKAAEQGNAIAQYNLGWMYQNGKGVPQDDAEAVKWYRKAAEQGDADAQYNLDQMKIEGIKVGKAESVDSPADVQRQAVSASPADWIPRQILLDDYMVERVLGEGGMGKVYLVKSQTTNMRFAVKRAKGLKEGDRRNFLAELQTWIDLPEHPNLVPCRFFRTVGDEVLIFAEYVEGGNLKDWITSRKLYAGGTDKALERMLDTVIQFAWGLHCLHELGLVHQDVKPANVMMTVDVQEALQGLGVRVTDFGLARARVTVGDLPVSEIGQSIVVSSGGYTPAYCSPEQAAGRKLDRRTDVWSWGVSVLEMFQGEVVWQSGSVAAKVLEAFLDHSGEEVGIPALPVEVAALLKGCFREDPAQRWQNMGVVVQKLKCAYQSMVGAEYSRAMIKIEQKSTPQVGIGERRAGGGASWTDPREWLERAFRAEGRDPAEAVVIMARYMSSRRGQLVADLAAYDEVRRIYERLIKDGRKDLENELASVCHEAAFVHETAGDSSGALALYDLAVDILERLVNVEGRRELANGLANLYRNKADVVIRLGDNRAAVDLLDHAIEILRRLVNIEGRHELGKDLSMLAILYVTKANAVSRLGDKRAAVALYDQAIEIHKLFEGRRELGDILATSYMNKANAVRDLGDSRSALALYDRAIAILERLVNDEGRNDLAQNLAMGYMNKANAVREMGDNQAAMGLCDQGITILERLVNVEGRRELANDLATFYTGKAVAVGILGDNRAAVILLDRAITILERLVNVEGRRDLSNDLSMLYMNKANAIKNLGDDRAAVDLLDRAIAIRERLVNVEGRSDLADKLARVYLSKALAVGRLGDLRAEVVLHDQAIDILDRLVNIEGRRELANGLAEVYVYKAIAVGRLGDKRAPLSLFDQAIEIYEHMVNVEGRRELAGDLARVKAFHGGALIVLGDAERGKRESREAMSVLREEVNRNGRADLKWVLDQTAKQLGEE